MDNHSLVELHIHLEGAVKHETIFELLKKKNVDLPGNGTTECLKNYMVTKEPKDLAEFLKPLALVVPILQDIGVAERVAYELSGEMAKNNVKYVEARYSPHNFLPEQREVSEMTALEEVIRAVNRGFTRGEKDFGVIGRSILCGLNGTDGIVDVLHLSKIFLNEGVVGIDMATKQGVSAINEEILLDSKAIYVYEEAWKSGIHRTIHAGESGGPDMVTRAIDVFHAERIGHGYHVLDDINVYKYCIEENIHFECCPWSSILTGSVPASVKKHPIVRFAEDDINFSISSDDPTVTGHWIGDDYKLAKSWGISESTLKRTSINAAKNCFLPSQEKKEFMKKTFNI